MPVENADDPCEDLLAEYHAALAQGPYQTQNHITILENQLQAQCPEVWDRELSRRKADATQEA